LQSFRIELLQELKQLLSTAIPHKQKQWLKSVEVRKLLKISPGTLQNLRINGTLRYTKIGGLIYYSYEDIEKLLEENQVDNSMPVIDVRQTSFPFHQNMNPKP
jgi:ferric iron reductase protein FhuF